MKKHILLAFLVVASCTIPFTSYAYTVVKGDTFYKIALKYNLTLAQLTALNPQIKNTSLIYPGQYINTGTSTTPTTSTPTTATSTASTSPTTGTTTTSTTTSTSTAPTPSGTARIINKAYTTSYTWYDNTPAGSADIAYPILHSKAGGTGTYADPITIAVGHSISGGVDTPDFPKGTRFYIPNVQAYFIVEDVCGDGATPQNGPCHSVQTAPAGTEVWVDMWIDGSSATNSVANSCANSLTAQHLVVVNPPSGYKVIPGSIIQNGVCRKNMGETLILQ